MKSLLRWVLKLFPWLARGRELSPVSPPPPKTVVPLLVFPTLTADVVLDEATAAGDARHYVSSPWELGSDKVDRAVRDAEAWLTNALGVDIPWGRVRVVRSQRTVSEWRSRTIYLIEEEVKLLGLPWTGDYVYLAFVRGTGGYAGGIGCEDGAAGYAMVGDVCLEAICEYPEPTAGSVLLGGDGWPPNSYGSTGQTGAFIHEALHGLGLPHPDGWPEGDRPGWDETLMGNWWLFPNFTSANGLTQREVQQVLEWTGAPSP